MNRVLFSLFFLGNVLCIQGSAWAADSQELAQTSVANVQTLKQESEERNAALKQLVGEEPTVTAKVEAWAPPTHVERKVRRMDEPSFAVAPSAKHTIEAFAKLKQELMRIDDPAHQLASYQAFVEKNPTHRDARLHLARALMLNEEPSRVLIAMAPLTEAGHKRGHPDWQPWFWLGSAYLGLNEPEKAREALEIALSKEQEIAEVWVHMAIAEQAEGNHGGALQYLEIAERLAPRLAQVHLNKAYSYERRGELEHARLAYQTYLISEGSEVTRATRPAIVRHLAQLAQTDQS